MHFGQGLLAFFKRFGQRFNDITIGISIRGD
jgi:hypothetical protein